MEKRIELPASNMRERERKRERELELTQTQMAQKPIIRE
jgi:hypothetical protein